MTPEMPATGRGRRGAGAGLLGLVALFLLMDGGGKVLRLAPFVEGTVELGFEAHQVPWIGGLLLVLLLLYLVPRTSTFGAVPLTGYLGGAVAIQVQQGNPLLSHTLFPIYVGVAAWGGLALRDPSLLPRLFGRIPTRPGFPATPASGDAPTQDP